MVYPKKVLHWSNDKEIQSSSGLFFPKYNPATGKILAEVTKGTKADIEQIISSAENAFDGWKNTPVIKRSDILRNAVVLIQERKDEIAQIVALESGKSQKAASGEIDAAIECGYFFAGEGRRYSGEILPSAQHNRSVQLIRQSIGTGALITPFNNPMAGIAWKAFPALLCGNTVVTKSHEDTPYTGVWFAQILKEAGLPKGVYSVAQGLGSEIGSALVEDSRIKFISFTGSLETGRYIAKTGGKDLKKVSIESGGKNPFVVCDDADLEKAVSLAVSSAFVDAGQRCAAASRIIAFSSIYDKFKEKFLEKVNKLKVGTENNDDFGAIINKKRLHQILSDVKGAVSRGATLLSGGYQLMSRNGYFMAPTVLENVSPTDGISYKEIFGPVVILYGAKDLEEAIFLANNSTYKLTGAIHTKNINRAQEFINRYQAGVVRVNGPTFGSEPHMPFGGVGLSGNGWREPGAKALDFYSDWKQVSIDYDSSQV